MYENGDGIKPDKKRAIDLYRLACDGGNAKACTNLGIALDAKIGFATPK
jgi:TPR repeat protein